MFKVLVVGMCITISLVVSLLGGILAVANGVLSAGAILTGGGAFFVAVPATLSVANALGGL